MTQPNDDSERTLAPRFFQAGASAAVERLREQSPDAFAAAVRRLLDKCSDILTANGFKPSPLTEADARRSGFTAVLLRRADEAAVWINQRDATVPIASVISELAADTLGALAVLHVAFEEACATSKDAGNQSRLLKAAMSLGNYDAMLAAAEAGHFDGLALAEVRAATQAMHGRQGGTVRRARATAWKRRARADWAAYKGPLKRTSWAKENARHYGKQWRVVADAIKPSAETLQEASSLQT